MTFADLQRLVEMLGYEMKNVVLFVRRRQVGQIGSLSSERLDEVNSALADILCI